MLSKSNKAEDYRAFRDEIVETLKTYPRLAGDERLGRVLAQASGVVHP